MAKSLSPEQQWVRLKSSPICRGHGSVRRGDLNWEFDARPSPLGRNYRLRIKFRKYDFPDVFVLTPNLNELAGGKRLPHVYSTKPVRLCLHMPGSDEWTSDKSIADTIVPWTYLWLMYFEHWLATEEWQGGGKHPGNE
jgi:hypothetical protein